MEKLAAFGFIPKSVSTTLLQLIMKQLVMYVDGSNPEVKDMDILLITFAPFSL